MGKASVKAGRKLDAATKEKLQLAKKLSRIRKRERLGGEVTAEERALLDAHPKRAPGRPTVEEVAARPEVIEERDDEPIGDQVAPGEDPPRPPLAAPPPVRAVGKGGKDDWRAKYKTGVGREGACSEFAGAMVLAMKSVAKWIAADGGRPLFDDAFLDGTYFNCAVLTADKLLPADFDLSPEVECVALSSALLGQAAFRKLKAGKGGRLAKLVSIPRPEPKIPTVDAPIPTVPDRPTENTVILPEVVAPSAAPEPFIVRPDTLI